MQSRVFGRTGLTVSALGFGAMQAGDPALTEAAVAELLHGVLDRGLRVIDTARSYGLSEERIGRHLARRRDEYVLSTKVGYDVPGLQDWSYDCVVAGVEVARQRLATDVIDIVHLHSCDSATLEGGVIDALAACVARGWVRVAAYSGDGAPLDSAAADERIDALQVSFSCVDQAAAGCIEAAAACGVGVLVKRPLFGLPWRQPHCPADPPHADYWRRFQQLEPLLEGRRWPALALRFAAHAPGVACCLVGGTSLRHLEDNVSACDAGPLPEAEVAAICRAFRDCGATWRGVV